MSFKVIRPFSSINDMWLKEYIHHDYEGHKGKLSEIRVNYLTDYLDKLQARTAVVEHDYVDRNFMDDYCGYYARCFSGYPKKCERVHFFSADFNEDQLKEAALRLNPELRNKICESYLGFIVIRPVPGAHLGRVCLATYPSEERKQRQFPVLKSHDVHFLGLPLKVKTVAFQEQDNVISACATSALWSAFHAIRNLNIEQVPSPFKITDTARKLYRDDSGINGLEKGLYPSQMSAAINEEGFEPILTSFSSTSELKALVRAYLNVGLPVILGMTLAHENEIHWREVKGQNPIVGEHAVTVVGYKLLGTPIKPFKLNQRADGEAAIPSLYMLSSTIEKFYVHDDQVGPFASMESRDEYWQLLETRWNYYIDKDDKINASVKTILIPCFKKIRIQFPIILNFIAACNTIFGGLLSTDTTRLVWDVRLVSINEFKERIADNSECEGLDNEVRFEILSKKLPRFLWVVDGYWAPVAAEDPKNCEFTNDTVKLFTYLLDATDMENSDYFLYGWHHDTESFSLFRHALLSWKGAKLDSFLKKRKHTQLVLETLINYYLNSNKDKLLLHPNAPIKIEA